MKLRITKYNPLYRNEEGFYLREEWTSISDIGKIYQGRLFTAEQYFAIEDAYVDTVKLLLHFQGIDQLVISQSSERKPHQSFFTAGQYYPIDQNFTKSLAVGKECSLHEIEIITRLNLREDYWCSFSGKNRTYLHFGHDYYMYYGSDSDFSLNDVRFPKNIFIENDFQSPYL